jgi:hypothetical protein
VTTPQNLAQSDFNTGKHPLTLAPHGNVPGERAPVPAAPPVRPPPARPSLATAPAAGSASKPSPGLSPALVAALQRPVTLSIASEPAAAAAAKLAEAGDLAVRVDVDGDHPVSFQSQGAPLWQALQTVAQETGLVIEPNGDGVRFTRLALAKAPRRAGAGRQVQARSILRQQVEERQARAEQQPPAGGQVLAESEQTESLTGRRDAERPAAVWTAAWGDLPARQFGEANLRMASGNALHRTPAITQSFRTPAPPTGPAAAEPDGSRSGGAASRADAPAPGSSSGLGAGATAREAGARGGGGGATPSAGFGGGGFGGGFGRSAPEAGGGGPASGGRGAGPAGRGRSSTPNAPEGAPGARAYAARPQAPRDNRSVRRAAVPAQSGAPAGLTAQDRAGGGWVAVADGQILLVRAAGGQRYALLQPSRGRAGEGGGLNYRIWLRPGAAERARQKADLAKSLRKESGAAGPPRIDLLGGTLTWEAVANDAVRFRVLSGDLQLCPTPERDAAKLDPADAKWHYR